MCLEIIIQSSLCPFGLQPQNPLLKMVFSKISGYETENVQKDKVRYLYCLSMYVAIILWLSIFLDNAPTSICISLFYVYKIIGFLFSGVKWKSISLKWVSLYNHKLLQSKYCFVLFSFSSNYFNTMTCFFTPWKHKCLVFWCFQRV